MASIAPVSCSSPEPTDEYVLVTALRGDQTAWKKLVKRFDRYLLKIVRRRAAGLPEDLRQDVIQEVWAAAAMRHDGDFDPLTGSARYYISGFLSLALDQVRAAYRAPGERSRRRDAARSGAQQTHCELISLDELDEGMQPVDPRCDSARDKVDAVIDIQRARVLASPLVTQAIDVMWHEDLGCEAAAMAVGINRLTLRRQLRQLGILLAA